MTRRTSIVWAFCTLPGESCCGADIQTADVGTRPNNHVILDPINNSPLLQRLGLEENDFTKLGQHLTMEEWVKVRQSQQQRRTEAPKIEGSRYEYTDKALEIIPGLKAKVYN